MPIDACFEHALRSPNPVDELRAVAVHLAAQGEDRVAIIERFEEVRRQLRECDRETDEDALMDALDCLVGWCGPEMRLLDDPTKPSRAGLD